MGPGGGADRYGFPGCSRVWTLGEWSVVQRFAGTVKGAGAIQTKPQGLWASVREPAGKPRILETWGSDRTAEWMGEERREKGPQGVGAEVRSSGAKIAFLREGT